MHRLNDTENNILIAIPIILVLLLVNYDVVHADYSAWRFTAKKNYCLIETTIRSDKSNRYISPSARLLIYYTPQFDLSDPCASAFQINTITAAILPSRARIQKGTYALIESESLYHEQIPTQYIGQNCNIKPFYTPGYRVTNLVLDALQREENIQFTAYLEEFSPFTGTVPTKGYEAAHAKLMDCVAKLNQQDESEE